MPQQISRRHRLISIKQSVRFEETSCPYRSTSTVCLCQKTASRCFGVHTVNLTTLALSNVNLVWTNFRVRIFLEELNGSRQTHLTITAFRSNPFAWWDETLPCLSLRSSSSRSSLPGTKTGTVLWCFSLIMFSS
jgi:hypothetical protein